MASTGPDCISKSRVVAKLLDGVKKTHLVFVQLAVFILLLSLLLEGDDDKAHKYIHHEKGDEDEVDDEEDGNGHPVVVQWTFILGI